MEAGALPESCGPMGILHCAVRVFGVGEEATRARAAGGVLGGLCWCSVLLLELLLEGRVSVLLGSCHVQPLLPVPVECVW